VVARNEQRVEFPPSDRPEHQWTESEVDKIHGRSLRDLEGHISDCVWMSVIALEMVERAIEGRDDKQEKAMFAVFETGKEAKQSSRQTITPLGTVRSRRMRLNFLPEN